MAHVRLCNLIKLNPPVHVNQLNALNTLERSLQIFIGLLRVSGKRKDSEGKSTYVTIARKGKVFFRSKDMFVKLL